MLPEQFIAHFSRSLRDARHTRNILNTCQHPLDPATEYQPKEVRLTTWHSRPAPRNDLCRTRCPENERGYINTERYFL